MKKEVLKKGFTLIELLAVILILGIIALIAIPTVTNIINESKKGAFKSSVSNLITALEQKCEIERMNGSEITKQYVFSNSDVNPKIEMKGTMPISGTANVDDDCNVSLNNVSDGKYTASKQANSDVIVIEDKASVDNTLSGTIKKSSLSTLALPLTGASSSSEKSLIKGTDEAGDTYFFRGNVDNNYVEFGTYKQEIYSYSAVINGINIKRYYDKIENCETSQNGAGATATACSKLRSIGDPMIWRIIRVNGDGTVRMILQDSITVAIYSDGFDDIYYAGYTYDLTGTKSNIKDSIDKWYSTNIGSIKELDDLVAVTSFCNDVSTKDDSYDKYGFYANRLNESAGTITPSFTCPSALEEFGGKYNNLKAGLITADEAAYAGLFNTGSNTNYYLWNGDEFWTMTPSGYDGSFTYIFSAGKTLTSGFNVDPLGVRPVINLASTVEVTGTGKVTDMYKIAK